MSDTGTTTKGGPLAKWSAMRCAEPEFWRFLGATFEADVVDAGQARELVVSVCECQSRRDLDNVPSANEAFHRLIRGPYTKWLISRGLHGVSA